MPSVVSDLCRLCKSCVEVCPVEAFREGETMVVVSPDDCIECGVCISECPEGAIKPSDEADEKWIEFNAQKAAEWPAASR